MAWLEYLGKRVELTSGMVVGRSRKCELHVDDPRASRQHFRLEHDGARWWVVDLGASNPTRRNHQKIEGRMALGHEDVLTAGNSNITFFDPPITATGAGDDSQQAEPEGDEEEEFDATFLAPAPMAPVNKPSSTDSATAQVATPGPPPTATPAPESQPTPAPEPRPTGPHPTPQAPAPVSRNDSKPSPAWPPPLTAAAPAFQDKGSKALRWLIILLIILALLLGIAAAVLHFMPELVPVIG